MAQGYWPFGYREDLNGFTIHEHGGHHGHHGLFICITFVSPGLRIFLWNLTSPLFQLTLYLLRKIYWSILMGIQYKRPRLCYCKMTSVMTLDDETSPLRLKRVTNERGSKKRVLRHSSNYYIIDIWKTQKMTKFHMLSYNQENVPIAWCHQRSKYFWLYI